MTATRRLAMYVDESEAAIAAATAACRLILLDPMHYVFAMGVARAALDRRTL